MTKLMKILYVYDKEPTTYQSYFWDSLKAMKSKYFIQTMVFGGNGGHFDYKVESYGTLDQIYKILYKLGLKSFPNRALNLMAQFDLIHLQTSYLFEKIIPFLNQENPPKVVITLRGGDTYVKPWHNKRWLSLYKDYGNLIDMFVVMSHHQGQFLSEKWGVPQNRIKVIPISFGAKSEVSSPKYPQGERIKLIAANRMTWEKNIIGLFQFAQRMQEKEVPFSLEIYGEGRDYQQLFYLRDAFQLSDIVIIKGKVSNADLKNKLKEHDFLIQLSLSEALSAVVLESQAMGTPCIVSNAGGLPEAVVDEVTGLVGDINNLDFLVERCISLWQNKERYYQFSKEGIGHVSSHYSLNIESERLNELYEELLS